MAIDWEKTILGDEVQLVTGFPFKSQFYTDNENDIRLLRGDNIVQGMIRWDNAKRWSNADVDQYESFNLRETDVVLAMDRPWIDAGLKYAAISKQDLPCLLVQRTARLRVGKNLDSGYLRYLIGSEAFTRFVLRITTGSVVPHISSTQIKEFSFRRPPINLQKAISGVLLALDDKIELNNRINVELEGMAKLLYDYWFVQFDFPITAAQAASMGKPRLEGKPYRASGGKMIFNEVLKRNIPKGWESSSLGELYELYQPKTITESDLKADGKYFVYGANGIVGRYDSFNHAEPTVALTCRGSTCGTLSLTLPNSWITGNAMVMKPRNSCMCTDFAINQARNAGINSIITGSGQPQITRANLERLKALFPDKSFVAKFNEVCTPGRRQRELLAKQNQELTALRDWLLPMLMNGQVTVG